MLKLRVKKSFDKDYKKELLLGLDDELLRQVIEKLKNKTPLEPRFKDHALKGRWLGFRDCHIKPDLILIYKIDGEFLTLIRPSSHSELFK